MDPYDRPRTPDIGDEKDGGDELDRDAITSF